MHSLCRSHGDGGSVLNQSMSIIEKRFAEVLDAGMPLARYRGELDAEKQGRYTYHLIDKAG